jgi:carbamoyltransferase
VNRCIMGLTAAATQDGRAQLDGGAALFADGELWAVAEERVSRRKHAGGAQLALHAVLAAAGRSLADVDAFCVSTCGEPVPVTGARCLLSTRTGRFLDDLGVPGERVRWVPSHHLSHALTAWAPSPRGRALVLVMDEAGSAADGERLERTTCYLADDGLRRVLAATDPASPLGGVGARFRAATDLLGMDGRRDGGKTMALAAYGRRDRDAGVRRARASAHPRGAPFGHAHRALARAAQDELEAVVLDAVQRLAERHHARSVRLSGGVALNCVLAGRILRLPAVDDVVVAPAPGDTGQALGNCLWGVRHAIPAIPAAFASPFLGPRYGPARIERAIRAWGGRHRVTRGSVAESVAERLAAGGVVAVFHGRSEYGPRALGHRSILADPRDPRMRERLNRTVKRREWFRPFGMALLEEWTSALLGAPLSSPSMMIALPLAPAWRRRLPAVCHVDGTSRVQTVAAGGDPWMRAIIEAFHARTGVPALLNTSFNRAGEPIVETPEDALVAFEAMAIDALAIETHVLDKAA